MKKLLKVLGVIAGTYIAVDAGYLFGLGVLYEIYEYPETIKESRKEANEVVETASMANQVLFSHKKRKSLKKRSEVLHDYAEQWSKKGYSSEEIKQGLDALKKELD